MTNKIVKKTPPKAGGGRPKGSPNKTTGALKDAILKAAEGLGEDMQGQGGLTGYLRFLGQNEPKAFAGLLGKVLPMQVAHSGSIETSSKEQRDAAVQAAIRANS